MKFLSFNIYFFITLKRLNIEGTGKIGKLERGGGRVQQGSSQPLAGAAWS